MKKLIKINNAQILVANTWWDFMKKSIEIMQNTSGQYVVGFYEEINKMMHNTSGLIYE